MAGRRALLTVARRRRVLLAMMGRRALLAVARRRRGALLAMAGRRALLSMAWRWRRALVAVTWWFGMTLRPLLLVALGWASRQAMAASTRRDGPVDDDDANFRTALIVTVVARRWWRWARLALRAMVRRRRSPRCDDSRRRRTVGRRATGATGAALGNDGSREGSSEKD
jgi:hypothetical protein